MSSTLFTYRPLGGPVLGIHNHLDLLNGCTIPQLGYGTYRVPASKAAEAVTFALSCGYRHVDCAKAYCNEVEVGVALSQALRTRRVRRADLFVTSKLWPTDQHPDHVEAACRSTLSALQLDYLDLYLVHWPVCLRHTPVWNTDEDRYPRNRDGTPALDTSVTLLDTWTAMNRLVEVGLVKSIGVSNCTSAHVVDLMKGATDAKLPHLPVLNQVEQHPALLDGELVKCHGAHGMLTAAYAPLGMPGRDTPSNFQSLLEDEVLLSLSKFNGFSPARILLNWSLDRNNVVLVKATQPEHIKSNAKAARFALDDATRMTLDGYRFVRRNFRITNPTLFSADGTTRFFAAEDARLQRDIDSRRVNSEDAVAPSLPWRRSGMG